MGKFVTKLLVYRIYLAGLTNLSLAFVAGQTWHEYRLWFLPVIFGSLYGLVLLTNAILIIRTTRDVQKVRAQAAREAYNATKRPPPAPPVNKRPANTEWRP